RSSEGMRGGTIAQRLARPSAARAPRAVFGGVLDEHGIDEQRPADALDAEVGDERVGRVPVHGAAARVAWRRALEAGRAQVLAALDLELPAQAIAALEARRHVGAEAGVLGRAAAAPAQHEVPLEALELAAKAG